MANPLDSFKSSPATANDFKLAPLPKLAPLTENYGLKAAVKMFDDQMEVWRRQAERDINEKLGAKDNTAVQASKL